ncbi:MAG TPA: phage holin family protein [Bacteroidia bacterium]|jgi:putative membrane protein|nr:phage holin family protein [Bacteroidia bacterium]
MNFIARLLVSALAVFLVANFAPGVQVDNIMDAVLVAVVLAFLNTIVKPIFTLLTIPITIFTMGFFLLAINAFIILWAEKLVTGFHVKGFWYALLFSILLSIITGILNMLFGISNVQVNINKNEEQE